MQSQIKIIGVFLIVLALLHIYFPKYFNWDKELKSLSLINRQMMTIHTFFIALTVFLMGLLCLSSSNELIESSLGKKICLGFAIFWSIRLFLQFFGYSKKLWLGKTFETTVHVFFVFIWAYLSFVFFKIAFFSK